MEKTNSNLRQDVFTESELAQYVESGELKQCDIKVIMDYQRLLPILQQEDGSWIDARTLHKQLGVGKDFTNWIKGRIAKYDFIENEDYKLDSPKLANQNTHGGDRKSKVYAITLDMAKELAMVENNEIGRTTRKYFIAMDKAFTSRHVWNINRWETLDHYKHYRNILNSTKDKLITTMPEWCHAYGKQGAFMGEANLLNDIILGMKSSEYKVKHHLPKHAAIRNYFTNLELQLVAELEKFDTDLIALQEMYNYDERKKLLIKKYHVLLNSMNNQFTTES